MLINYLKYKLWYTNYIINHNFIRKYMQLFKNKISYSNYAIILLNHIFTSLYIYKYNIYYTVVYTSRYLIIPAFIDIDVLVLWYNFSILITTNLNIK